MKKVFEQYGSIIVVAIAIVGLIAVVGFLSGGENGGVAGEALHKQVNSFAKATDLIASSSEADESTYYTTEEIAADVHLYPIGATHPEYVVAKFSDDYSEVVITRNGENSDGMIADYSWMESPMWKNSSTLETAVVKKGVKNISAGLFEGCSLTSVTLSKGLRYIEGRAFMECPFTTVDIPSTVTSIGENAFYGCMSLETVNLSGKLQTIGAGAFYSCSMLQSITIPDSVTSIGNYAFFECSELKSVKLSESLTTIPDDAFCSCYALETVVIPDNVTSVGERAFSWCSGLTTITIPAGVTSIPDDTFTFCDQLTTVKGVAGSYAETFANANGLTFVAI